jgi:hypothetical protein
MSDAAVFWDWVSEIGLVRCDTSDATLFWVWVWVLLVVLSCGCLVAAWWQILKGL